MSIVRDTSPSDASKSTVPPVMPNDPFPSKRITDPVGIIVMIPLNTKFPSFDDDSLT
jgi:hypothetical protein